MPLKRLIQVPLFFLLILPALSAQYSPSVQWKKIEKEHILLIFPEELSEKALILANTIDKIYERESRDFRSGKQTRWPLILTSSGMVSNGYVYMPPRKSVWFGTPAAEGLSTLDWYDLLGLHETRHMVQMDSLNRRFIRFLYYIGGELAQTGGIHLSIPRWFLEGDAVSTETKYSGSGRGRDPLFYEQVKVLSLEGEYSYQQFVNRSYKTYFPDHYSFGYLMTTYISREYGDDSWDEILETAATFPLPALGFYLGAKQVTGKPWNRLFLDMMADLRQKWKNELETLELREDRLLLNELPLSYSRYEVLFSDKQGVLAQKYSLTEAPQLVRILEGKETVLRRLQPFAGVSSNGRQIIWTYNRPSLLYDSLNWSDLISYDLESRRKNILTNKRRLLFPAFSPAGDRVALIYWSEKQEGYIHVLRSSDAGLLAEYKVPEEGFPSSPSWSEDEKILYFLNQNKKGRAILSLDLENSEFTVVKDYDNETIKGLTVWKNYLIYASNASGLENIMALNLGNKEVFQLTFRALGVASPYVGKGVDILYYSDIRSIRGSVPVAMALDPKTWKPFIQSKEKREERFPYLEESDWTIESLTAIPDENEIQDYSLFSSGFNIHSWGISPNLESLTGLRLNLQSANVMGTFNWSTGAEYEINERNWGTFLDLDWKKIYPVISLRNSADHRILSGIELFDIDSRIVFSFPMNLSRDLWNVYVNPAVSSGIRAYLPLQDGSQSHYFPVNSGIAAYAVLPGSTRSVTPLWGISERYGSSINPAEPTKFYQHYSDSVIYTPGFFRNTGFQFGLAFEEQSGNYTIPFPFARGYRSSAAYRTLKASGDYNFPIAYPDSGFGSFFYVRRIRGNLFYDYLIQGDLLENNKNFSSMGTELIFDFTVANQEQGEFNLGFRFLWLVEENKPSFQLSFMNASF